MRLSSSYARENLLRKPFHRSVDKGTIRFGRVRRNRWDANRRRCKHIARYLHRKCRNQPGSAATCRRGSRAATRGGGAARARVCGGGACAPSHRSACRRATCRQRSSRRTRYLVVSSVFTPAWACVQAQGLAPPPPTPAPAARRRWGAVAARPATILLVRGRAQPWQHQALPLAHACRVRRGTLQQIALSECLNVAMDN